MSTHCLRSSRTREKAFRAREGGGIRRLKSSSRARARRAGVGVGDDDDTIAAIATGPGGSVGIVRVSGIHALHVLRRVFMLSSKRKGMRRVDVEHVETHRVLHGYVVETNTNTNTNTNTKKKRDDEWEDEAEDNKSVGVVDEVLAIVMRAPRSYTGEDVVEIHTHGGGVHAKRVLNLVLGLELERRDGDDDDDDDDDDDVARMARRGEFTQRAFMNGRIDLTQAEAVAAAVGAATPRQADIALAGVAGAVSNFTKRIREDCLHLCAEIEAAIDYGDELDEEEAARGTVTAAARVEAMLREIDGALAASRRNSVVMREEVVVAILGRPNAGKSSLVNAMVGSERFIVTSTPGTTRDVNEARVVLGGEIEAKLLDTAGIREFHNAATGMGVDAGGEGNNDDDATGANEIEMMGIRRSASAAKVADAVLFVVDVTAGITREDIDICSEHLSDRSRAAMLVLNKADAMHESSIGTATIDIPEDMQRALGHELHGGVTSDRCALVSARDGTGMLELQTKLLKLIKGEHDANIDGPAPIEDSMLWCANERQEEGLSRARDSLELVLSSIASGVPSDLWIVDLRGAALHLGEVDGTEVALGEEVLDTIFQKFCLGK